MQATGVADVSAGPRPMHRRRPTSSSSTPSSTDTEDAAPQSTPPLANLHVHSQEETSRSDPPSCSSASGPCQPHGPVVSTSMSGSSSGQPPGPNRERCKGGSMDGTSGGLPAEPAPLSQHGGMGMPPQAGSSNSEEASSEEMIPDHLLPRRVPPAPPLPRRLRSVQISTSGASSSAAPPRRVRGRSDTSSSSELREDDTTSSSESAGTVKGAPDRGRVIQHMDALRAKLTQALTKRAKMNPLNVPGLLYHCHAQCLPAMSSTLMRVALCKVGWPRPTSVPCRGRRVCPEYLVCCSRPWSAISIKDHTQDRSDGYPALRATDQAETSRQLDGNGYRTRAQVAFGHRQLRVLLVSSHACHGWSYRDTCRLYDSKRPALLCAAIAITLLCYAVLVVHRSDCSEMLRSPTLNTTERRAELGPKSQHRDCKHRYLLFALLLLLNHTTLAEGAGTDPGKPRVVIGPATMTGASTGIHTSRTTDEAKTCGEGPKQPSPNIRKIAFRKATAAGLAQYRGRTLRAAPRSEPSSQQGTVPTLSRSRNPPHSLVKTGRITIMSYNAGGLSTHHYTELLAWLHIQRRQRQGPDVVMVQETHWLGEQDYSNDEWHVLACPLLWL